MLFIYNSMPEQHILYTYDMQTFYIKMLCMSFFLRCVSLSDTKKLVLIMDVDTYQQIADTTLFTSKKIFS